MIELLKRLHIWAGLFNFSALIVFGLTGLWAALWSPVEASRTHVLTRPYDPPGNFSDRQVANDLFDQLDLPLAAPAPDWAALEHDERNRLILTLHSVNGPYLITVDEDRKLVLVEQQRHTLGRFLDAVHATTLNAAAPDVRVLLWAAYVDTSIALMLFLAASGTCLWVASRPRLWWAWLSAAVGSGVFVVLWAATR